MSNVLKLAENVPTLAERVRNFREAGKAIPKAWQHVRPAPSPILMEDDFLRSITDLKPQRQAAKLMGMIAATRNRGMRIPECWVNALEAVCEQKRFKKWRKRFDRKSREGVKRAAAPLSRPKVKVTRTVEYRYDQADNARLEEFYASREWKLIRYEALRLHGGRCQCCGASPEEGKRLHVDHIVAVRVAWERRLDLSNLQVLCADCNEGKGARHADDWRHERSGNA